VKYTGGSFIMDETQQEYFLRLPLWLQEDYKREKAKAQRAYEETRKLMNPLLVGKIKKRKVPRQAALDQTTSIRRKSRRMVGDFSILDEE
jgi:hypothetical protein